MINRSYYSERTGKLSPDQEIDLKTLKRLFLSVYNKLEEAGYFQKYFGFRCEDGDIIGELGKDLEAIFILNLRKDHIYPVKEKLIYYSEDDLFDVIEFLHDYCSKGRDKYYHEWGECGYHYSNFDDTEGQDDFREQINLLLKYYGGGYEISKHGEIMVLPENEMKGLFEAEIPTNDIENIETKILNATLKFRRYKSTWDDRKAAIRELADVLEYLRSEAKKHLIKQDEADLFNIANNFAIRHHNSNQKNNYDKSIWYSWMFYFYLATIHALLRIINKAEE